MTPEQCTAARQVISLSLVALAKAAGLRRVAVERFETGEDVPADIQDQLKRTLEASGVEFFTGNGGRPGVRLRKQQ